VNHYLASSLALSARGEGWAWWLVLVVCLILVFLLLSVLRRRLVRPMDHKPSDTTDAWAEAGRRLSVKPDDQNEQDSQAEDTG
jgi:membrane protein implicated in regulation of membrane protease activity